MAFDRRRSGYRLAHRQHNRIKNHIGSQLNISLDDDTNTDERGNEPDLDAKATRYSYKPPVQSESFRKHLESVESSWPYDSEDAANDSNGGSNKVDSDGGVQCTGEPSMDPSRMIQNVLLDGESNWI